MLLPIFVATFGIFSAHAIFNPAQVFCTQLKGEYGGNQNCKFDEAQIDGWTLYRQVEAKSEGTQIAVDHFFRRGNQKYPTNVSPKTFCTKIGGKYQTDGNQLAKTYSQSCVFSDNSMMDTVTLMRGFEYPGNSQLAEILKTKVAIDEDALDDGTRPPQKKSKARKGAR